ncbi:ribosomal protein L7/L12 [Catenulispora sp. NF23]|nr:ribosomal protein L7/L12 [Catenulispora pinistramenti]
MENLGPELFDVMLVEPASGLAVINTWQVVRDLTGLRELDKIKALINAAPSPVLQSVTRDRAERARASLENSGAVAVLLPVFQV